MTPKQQELTEEVRRLVWKNQGGEGKEIKKFEVREGIHRAYVVIEIGLVNDKGTMAEILCRDRRHIAIGKRGGLKLLNTGRYDKKSGRIVPKSKKAQGGRVFWDLVY